MDVAADTHVGHVRSRNEDALLADPQRGLFVVADGLGGHVAGDVASRIAVASIDRALDAAALGTSDDLPGRLVEVLVGAHEDVVSHARDNPDQHGMGTTAVVAHVSDDGRSVALAHAGDSRAYVLRGDADLQRLTADHVSPGLLGRALTQALGTQGSVSPDGAAFDLGAGDRLLLCTDGLTDMLDDRRISRLLATGSVREACDGLIRAALDRGGVDNVTVIVVDPQANGVVDPQAHGN